MTKWISESSEDFLGGIPTTYEAPSQETLNQDILATLIEITAEGVAIFDIFARKGAETRVEARIDEVLPVDTHPDTQWKVVAINEGYVEFANGKKLKPVETECDEAYGSHIVGIRKNS